MNIICSKLIAALACAAALTLGACSGGNPPPADSGTADPGSAGPGTTDPGADGRTEAERAFDAALAKAEADLAAARNRVAAATVAVGTTDVRKTALADIAAARKELTDAIAAARALEAPSDDPERIGRAARLVGRADAASAEDLATLRAAERSGTGWSGTFALIEQSEILRPVPATRYRRRNADGSDAATLLEAEKLPPVMYEDGKIVMSPGLASSGDRLRMRGIPVVITQRRQSDFRVGGDFRRYLYWGGPAGTPRPLVDPVGGGNNGVEPNTVAGLRITPSGLVVDIGGKGAQGLDFRLPSRFTNFARVELDGSDGGYDLKLEFGRPMASPEGNAERYWVGALMPTPEHLQEPTISNRLRDGRELGVYSMRLSSHAGLDRNLEDPDDPEVSARDDVNYYLSYAAYGHMEFVDSIANTSNTDTITPGRRTFPFHAGYDAFKDEAGMKTTDVADADKITRGTFKGRTLASQFRIVSVGYHGDYPQLSGTHYSRLRGDVRLTATISGTAADNRISGRIMNLESWNEKGYWEDYARITSALTLQASEISADGEFRGVIDTASLPAFEEGGYRGNFYGPLADLEAAGIWYLQDSNPAATSATDQLKLSIVGSFGAALVREDGTYGAVAEPVGN